MIVCYQVKIWNIDGNWEYAFSKHPYSLMVLPIVYPICAWKIKAKN